jgi:hypothetical protein
VSDLTKDSSPEQVREAWVAALRSGEYEQGRGLLVQSSASGDRHCCLGVLCKLAVKAGLATRTRPLGYRVGLEPPELRVLPQVVEQWAGLVGSCAQTNSTTANGNPITLATLNDERGYTFEMIADLIEAGEVRTQ